MNLAELKEAYKARKLALDSAKKEEEKYKALLKDAMLEAGESDYTDEAGYRFERIVQERKSMDEEKLLADLTNRLNEHDEILKSNSEMIGAIKELATEVKYMRGDLNETVERLNKLEGKDGDKWDKFKWLIVTGLVTLILGYLAVSVGLK